LRPRSGTREVISKENQQRNQKISNLYGGFMGQHFFESLTKTGLQSPAGPGAPPSTTFYSSPADAMNVANAALSKQAGPSLVNAPPTSGQLTPGAPVPNAGPVPGPGGVMPMDPRSQAQIAGDAENVNPPQLATSGGGPQFSNTTPTNLPNVVKPAFNEASTDQYGNVKPISPNSGLTKLGTLMTILRGAVQGGSDALAGGALDAHNGPDHPSAFGHGWGAAKQMPLMRAAQQRAAQEDQAKIQQTQAQTQNLQGETALHQAQIPYFLQRGKAYNALAQQRGNLSTKQQLDLATQQSLDDGKDPNLDPNVLQLRQAYGAEQVAGNSGKGAAPKPTQQDVWNQRAQEADQLGLPADQRKFYIVNGKLHEPVASNPRQPTDYDIWKSNPQGWNAYHSAQNDNKGGLTANQRSAIEGKYSSDLNKLGQNYQLDTQTGMYNAKDGTVATPQDYEQFKDGIANERFNRYLAAGETPPDLSAASPNPSPVSAHGNSQPAAPTGKKSVLPFLPKGKTQRPPLSSFDRQGVTQ
jgi:hypothetical protein